MTANCQHCRDENFTTVKRQEADGHWVIFRQCAKCGNNWDGKFIKKDKWPGWEALPTVYSGSPPSICSRCGKEYAQAHHYYPQAIGRETGVNPDSYPVGDLCDDCHTTWHKDVTPGLLHKNWKAAKNGAH